MLAPFDILSMDADAFREWARLMQGQSNTLIYDAMIASIAIVNRLTVATRNVRDFEQLGVQVLNPFEE